MAHCTVMYSIVSHHSSHCHVSYTSSFLSSSPPPAVLLAVTKPIMVMVDAGNRLAQLLNKAELVPIQRQMK